MKSIFTRAGLIAGLTALLSIAAFAQTTAPQNGGNDEGRGGRRGRMGEEGRMRGERGERRGDGGGGGRGMLERRALNRLNLSDAQRARLREIEARYAESFKSQRLEMRRLIELREQGERRTPEQRQRAQQLRGELRDSAEKMQAELRAVLTPEQRDQLKRMREEGEARRRQRRENRGAPDDDQ